MIPSQSLGARSAAGIILLAVLGTPFLHAQAPPDDNPTGPAGYVWRGQPVGGAGTLSGPWTGSGNAGDYSQLQGRKTFEVIDPETGEFIVHFLPPVDGDNIGFSTPEIFFVPLGTLKSITLPASPVVWGTAGFGMRNAEFNGGGITAGSISIQNQPLNAPILENTPNQMTFNDVSLEAGDISIFAGEFIEQVDSDVDLTFNGGKIEADFGITINGSFAPPIFNPLDQVTGDIQLDGTELNAATLIVNEEITTPNFSRLNLGLENVTSTVTGSVRISYDDTSEVNLDVSGGDSIINWATESALTELGVFGDVNATFRDGGTVNTNDTFVALAESSQVTVEVDGATWNAAELGIGGQGRAEVTLKNGAELTSAVTRMGTLVNSLGLVSSVTLEDTSKWTINGFLVVGQSGNARIDVNDQSTVDLNSQLIAGLLEGSKGEINVKSGNTFDVETTTEFGRDGFGELNVIDGGTFKSGGDFFVGTFSKGEGEVRVDGADSTLELSGNLNIGNGSSTIPASGINGKGTVLVENGGEITIEDFAEIRVGRRENSEGSLTFDGADSKLTFNGADQLRLVVGQEGTGSLTLRNGASIRDEKIAVIIGEETNGNGTVTVRDNSVLEVGRIVIGDAGEGKLSIQNDASIQSTTGPILIGVEGKGTLELAFGGKFEQTEALNLGVNQGSEGTILVRDADSLFTARENVTLGEEGKGFIEVRDGGEFVSEKALTVGAQNGGEGTVTVDGFSLSAAPSKLTYSELRIGALGKGTVNVENGGQLLGSGGSQALSLGFNAVSNPETSNGTLNVKGLLSQVTVDNTEGLFIGDLGRGTVNVEEGARITMSTDSALILGNGLAQANGTLNIKGGDAPSQMTAGNELFVGNLGTGILTIEGGASLNRVSASESITQIATVANSAGTVSVTGPGSVFETGDLFAGGDGVVGITISDGASMQSNFVDIKNGTAETNILITGSGDGMESTWSYQANDTGVGFFLQGQTRLTVTDGARLVSRPPPVGASPRATFQVGGDRFGLNAGDATLSVQNGGRALLGNDILEIQNNGTVEILNGGQINSGGVQLNRFGTSGGDPSLILNGGSLDASIEGRINLNQTGQITATNGSSIAARRLEVIGDFGNTANNVLLNDSSLTLTEAASLSIDARVSLQNGATAAIANDLLLLGATWDSAGGATTIGIQDVKAQVGQTRVNTGGVVSGFGTIEGDLILGGGTSDIPGGVLDQGQSPGSIFVDGNFLAEAGSRIILEAAGTGEGMFDFLDVSGRAVLEPGVLIDLIFIDEFVPTGGESFNFFQAGGGLEFAPELAIFTVSGLPEGLTFFPVSEDGTFSISVPDTGTTLGLALMAFFGLTLLGRFRPGEDH